MSELDERQICLGCRKRINLLIDGYRCRDCPFFFCGPCADYHFGRTNVSPVTGQKDPPTALEQERDTLRARVEELEDENGSLRSDLDQKSGEIGRAEHRGNTVNYIYDKLAVYSKQLTEVVSQRDILRAECRALREGLEDARCDNESLPQRHHAEQCGRCIALASAPLTAAESARVAKMERVVEAARALRNWTMSDTNSTQGFVALEKSLDEALAELDGVSK